VYDGKVVVVVSEENLAGMLGLVANEISNRYSRPAVVFCDAGDHYVGSCRGPDKFNCNEMIRTLGNLVISGGGHKGAAGMSVSKEKIRLVVEEIVRYSDLLPPITVSDYMADIEMDCSYIPLVESEVNKLSPFGHKFEAPVFASTIYVDAINWIGKTQKHIRVTSSDIDFLFFNASGDIMSVEQGDTIRVAYELSRSRSKFAKRPSVITRVMEKLS
jgi:single-stranded-DNA-specific exonuclease